MDEDTKDRVRKKRAAAKAYKCTVDNVMEILDEQEIKIDTADDDQCSLADTRLNRAYREYLENCNRQLDLMCIAHFVMQAAELNETCKHKLVFIQDIFFETIRMCSCYDDERIRDYPLWSVGSRSCSPPCVLLLLALLLLLRLLAS